MFDINNSRDFYQKLSEDFDDFMERMDSARHGINCATARILDSKTFAFSHLGRSRFQETPSQMDAPTLVIARVCPLISIRPSGGMSRPSKKYKG
jgi:hypothetical protein